MIRSLSSDPVSLLIFAATRPFYRAHLLRLFAMFGVGAAALGVIVSIFQRNAGAFLVLLGIVPSLLAVMLMYTPGLHPFRFEFFAVCAIASVMAFTLMIYGFNRSQSGIASALLMVPINAVYLIDLFLVTMVRR